MSWYMLHETETGRPVSQTDVEPVNWPSHLSVKKLNGKPAKGFVWDDSLKTFIEPEVTVRIDMVDDFMDSKQMKTISLPNADRQKIKNQLIKLVDSLVGLGRYRYRSVSEVE